MNEGGFFLNIGVILPSNNCYIPLGFTNNSKDHFNPGPSLEVGNMFVITELSKHALGVRATWLTASYSSWSDNDFDMAFLEGGIVRLGPYFTFSVNDDFAVDGYYQIGADYAIDVTNDTDNTGYLGLSHNAGVSLRYKIFTLGFDYNFGNVKYLDKDKFNGLSDEMINDFYKIRTAHLRIFVGFKF
jgi:hypothetical protein